MVVVPHPKHDCASRKGDPVIAERFLSTPAAKRSDAPDLRALLKTRSGIRGGAAIVR